MRLLPSQQAHYEILIWEDTNGLLLDFRSDRRRGDADAVDTKAAVCTERDWPFLILASVMDKIRGALVRCRTYCVRSLALQSYSIPWCCLFSSPL